MKAVRSLAALIIYNPWKWILIKDLSILYKVRTTKKSIFLRSMRHLNKSSIFLSKIIRKKFLLIKTIYMAYTNSVYKVVPISYIKDLNK